MQVNHKTIQAIVQKIQIISLKSTAIGQKYKSSVNKRWKSTTKLQAIDQKMQYIDHKMQVSMQKWQLWTKQCNLSTKISKSPGNMCKPLNFGWFQVKKMQVNDKISKLSTKKWKFSIKTMQVISPKYPSHLPKYWKLRKIQHYVGYIN